MGIVAKAVDDRKDRRRATTQRNTIIQDRIGNRYGTGVINGDVRRLDRLNGVDVNPSYKRVRLPAQCQRVLETRGRQYLVYGQRCLSQNYQHTARLPATCERRVRGAHNRIRTFYGARCLANDGWRVARR